MTKARDLHEKWLKAPEYQAAYAGMAEEFELASAVISARDNAGITQEELAERMNAKQSLIARLESGTQNTTIKTLHRIAEATGTHLKISFE
jgi:ribosome-binding protein aMBF1 (putative translation factor)